MSRRMSAWFTTGFVLMVAVGCKTTGEPSIAGLDGDAIAPSLDEREEFSNIPISLWSPEQRRATAGYYFLAGEMIALKERDGKKALPIYEAAYGLDPNPYLGGKMLAAKAAAGQRPEALLEARKMVLLYPKDAHLRYLYGQLLTEAGQSAAAITELERCIELDSNFEPGYLELIDLYQSTKQLPKAIVVAKDLVVQIPSSIIGWSQLSRLYLAQSQYKDALLPAQRAWEMQSTNPHLTQVYAIVLQMNGKTKLAIRMYEQLYRLDPTDEDLIAQMIDLYREIGNLEDALQLLDEMIREGGEVKPGVQMQKALLLWELKHFEEASELLSGLAREYPDSDRLKYLSALGLERMNKGKDALEVYRDVPANSPFRYHADFRMVVILKNLKRYDEAVDLARKMLSNNSADWDAYGLLGGVLADSERYDEAVKAVDNGFQKYPNRPHLLFLKGVYQEKAGDRDACIKTMREVIQKDPTNSSAHNYLGYLFAERGENLDEAEKLIKKALELKANDGFYLDSLGWVYFQKGDYKQASETLEKALAIEPKEGVILEHLGDLRRSQKNASAAIEYYERALKEELEAKDRKRIEAKLAATKSGKH